MEVTLRDAGWRADEYGQVIMKIATLGRQMRDAREIFSALKRQRRPDHDQPAGWADAVHPRLARGAGQCGDRRLSGRDRGENFWAHCEEIFSPESALGSVMLDAFRLRHNVAQREIEASNGRRIQVSLDFIQEKGTQIGALLTMRDAESVRRIEDEIELSRRISASGRVTRGVAHEVKNPINAIVLHLQLLRNKLQDVDPDTSRHVDIIDSEIHRLDRVVQILVDFTRPRDLHLEETDLRLVLEEVALLAAPDAEQHGVKLVRELPADSIPVKVDVDFIKQAILNVVLNGVQAMPDGGTLAITAHRTKMRSSPKSATKAPASQPPCRTKFLSCISPPRKPAAESAWPRRIRS